MSGVFAFVVTWTNSMKRFGVDVLLRREDIVNHYISGIIRMTVLG